MWANSLNILMVMANYDKISFKYDIFLSEQLWMKISWNEVIQIQIDTLHDYLSPTRTQLVFRLRLSAENQLQDQVGTLRLWCSKPPEPARTYPSPPSAAWTRRFLHRGGGVQRGEPTHRPVLQDHHLGTKIKRITCERHHLQKYLNSIQRDPE